MHRSARSLALVVATALVAGCGGSSPDRPVAPGNSAQQQAAPARPLEVGVTDGGIGTAALGGAGGVTTLPNGPVKARPNADQGVAAGANCKNTDLMPTRSDLSTVTATTLCLLNAERDDKGLPPLKTNPRLASAAIRHSRDMVARHYFDHVEKNGSDPVARIRKAGYIPRVGAWTVGENLAWGTGVLATPKEIVKAWMSSQGHRENILRSQFREIGFGVVVGNPLGNDGGATYTTTFGGVTGARSAGARKRAKGSGRSVRRTKARAARAHKTRRFKARISFQRPR